MVHTPLLGERPACSLRSSMPARMPMVSSSSDSRHSTMRLASQTTQRIRLKPAFKFFNPVGVSEPTWPAYSAPGAWTRMSRQATPVLPGRASWYGLSESDLVACDLPGFSHQGCWLLHQHLLAEWAALYLALRRRSLLCKIYIKIGRPSDGRLSQLRPNMADRSQNFPLQDWVFF